MALKKTGSFRSPISTTPLTELVYRYPSFSVDVYAQTITIPVYAFCDLGTAFAGNDPYRPPVPGAALDLHARTAVFAGADFWDLAARMETPSAAGVPFPGISDLIYSKLRAYVFPGDEAPYFADAEDVFPAG